MRQLTVRIPEDEYKLLDQICDQQGYSKVKLIRTLIRKFIGEATSSSKEKQKDLEQRFLKVLAKGILLNVPEKKLKESTPLKVKGKKLSTLISEGRD